MNIKLFLQVVIKFLVGLLSVCLLLFLSAGTILYLQAWLFIGILFIPMFVVGLIMMKKNPDLLQKRINNKEKQNEQKEVVFLSAVIFTMAFVIAGLNYRFEWIILPEWISCVATVIFLLAYILYIEVLRENIYLSRVIEIQKNQKVVDRGLYGIVRHPMYMTTILLFLSMPLVLGSIISFLVMLAYIPIILKRIQNEERVLEKGLEGYVEYKKRVKYKIIPFIW